VKKKKPAGKPQPASTPHGVRYHLPPKGQVDIGSFEGLGFERVTHLPGSTYKDNSTVIIVPARDTMVDLRVQQTWQGLMAPMNQKRAMLFATGDEVGVAYTRVIQQVLADPELSKWKYIMTMETDNLQPPDAHIKLLQTIEAGPYDGVSGIYYTKGDINMPMAYGDPEEYARTGVLDFRPRDVREAQAKGHVMEVNGIAMGCSLYRMELFRQLEPPWFVTVADVVDGSPIAFTQDLYFCKNARSKGKRFAVDFRVVVGHLDLATGIIY
jgi:hypothetical protein